MNVKKYHRYRKIVKLIENSDNLRLIELNGYYDLKKFIEKQTRRFLKKVDFHRIYKRYDEDSTLIVVRVKLTYYLDDLHQNRVVKRREGFYVDVDYDEYQDSFLWDVNFDPLYCGDLLLAFKIKFQIENFKNKFIYVLKKRVLIEKDLSGCNDIEYLE